MARFMGLGVILSALPWAVSPYALDTVSAALTLGMFALSINLLWGHAGILNLGPAAFFGLGGYLAGLALREFGPGWGAGAGLLLVLLGPAALAVVIGYASFRAGVSRIYYALITLAVSLVLERVAMVWTRVTGGSNGLTPIARPEWHLGAFSLSLADNVAYYGLVSFVALGTLWFCGRLAASPLGSVLVAIRANPVKVMSLGYNITAYKVIITAIAAAIGGLAGALFVPISGIAYPAMFGVVLSMQGFVWVAVGGQRTLYGPFLAAVLLKLVESYLSGIFVTVYLLVLGVLFVAVVKLFPDGVGGFWLEYGAQRSRAAGRGEVSR